MNILIVNKYYFLNAGAERYLFTVSDALEKQGHKVVPFALDLSRNKYSKYDSYFIESPYGKEAAKIGEAKLNLVEKIKLVMSTIYSFRARKAVKKVIKDQQIEVVYLLNFCNYITPSVIHGAKELGVPVVMRMSDYNLVCSTYHYTRDGHICMECKSNTFNAVKHKCVRDSYFESLARVMAINIHRLIKIYHQVDMFVCPSMFMKKDLEDFGLPEKRIKYIPSFVDITKFKPGHDNEGFALFYGRLYEEKGIDVIIDAWKILGDAAPQLRIIGSGVIKDELEKQVAANGLTNVSFTPFLEDAEIREVAAASSFVLVPSVGQDNSPMVVYEAMSLGVPVIASRIGGIVDQVVDGVTGLLVRPGDPSSFADAVRKLQDDQGLRKRMGAEARTRAVELFSEERHLSALSQIFNDVVH